ncbi:MAG: GntR family transcriptional regulator, partial [Pseudomonadota bacterium]
MAITRPKTLRELALEHLRNSIIDGTLKMGQVLSERKISEELGVSKSPVRDALAQLREEGLVHIEAQKGAQVFTLSRSEVEQICDFRQVIETAAFELALSRNPVPLAADLSKIVKEMTESRLRSDEKRYLELDTQFHNLIFKHCGNDYLSSSYSRYIGKIAALRTHLSALPQHTELSFEEHKKLAEAVNGGNVAQIRKLLAEHIDRTRQAYAIA